MKKRWLLLGAAALLARQLWYERQIGVGLVDWKSKLYDDIDGLLVRQAEGYQEWGNKLVDDVQVAMQSMVPREEPIERSPGRDLRQR